MKLPYGEEENMNALEEEERKGKRYGRIYEVTTGRGRERRGEFMMECREEKSQEEENL